ncbi:MAG: hypothetical protein ACI83D_000336 [Planctomycetota bacterium]|jgi:hypothetical protein
MATEDGIVLAVHHSSHEGWINTDVQKYTSLFHEAAKKRQADNYEVRRTSLEDALRVMQQRKFFNPRGGSITPEEAIKHARDFSDYIAPEAHR